LNTGYSLRFSASSGTSGAFASTGAVSSVDSKSFDLKVIAVLPVYSGLGNWNDYVKADGTTPYDASGASCNPAVDIGFDSCLHGGELKKVEVPSISSCTNAEARDELGAFDWSCDDSGGSVVFYSLGLKETKALSDLIDFSTPKWKSNHVIISENSTDITQSESSIWWNNSVLNLPDSASSLVTLTNGGDAEGRIYVQESDVVSRGYNINDNQIALVVKPGQKLLFDAVNTCSSTGEVGSDTRSVICAGGQHSLWIEGGVSSNSGAPAFRFVDTQFLRLNDIHVDSPGRALKLENVRSSQIFKANGISSVADISLVLENSDYNYFKDLLFPNQNRGIELVDSDYNKFEDIDLSDPNDWALDMLNSHNNEFINVNAANTVNPFGMRMVGSNNNTFKNVDLSGAVDDALEISTSSNNSFYDFDIRNSGDIPIDMVSGSNSNRFYRLDVSGSVDRPNFEGSNDLWLIDYIAYNVGHNGLRLYQLDGFILVGAKVAGSAENNIYGRGYVHNAIFSHITSANAPSGYRGLRFNVASNNVTLNNTVIYGSGRDGLFMAETLNGFLGSQLVMANNGEYGLNTNAVSAAVTGNLLVGSNISGDCGVDGGDTFVAESSCTNAGTSNANLLTGIDLSGSFNATFDLLSSDTTIRNRSNDGVNPNSAFVSGLTCPAAVHGDKAISALSGPTFLMNAREIVEDGVGNDNGLCESGENCIYSPNFGYYQGHGDYSLNGTCNFVDGSVSGVTMYAYPNNGR
jgi:hypothetical protein